MQKSCVESQPNKSRWKTFLQSTSMDMEADIRTTLAELDYGWNDRKVFTAIASSDDDEIDPAEASDPAFNSVATPSFGHTYLVDSDDESLFSETSLETGLTAGSIITTGKTQDTSNDGNVDARNSDQKQSASGTGMIEYGPVYGVKISGKQIANFADHEQQGDIPVHDECDDERNDKHDVDERSRLMAAAQGSSIPSNDSFSDDSDVDKRSRLMAAAQAAKIPSNDSFSDDSVVDERSRLMAAAQAATIPSNDSISDDSEDDSPHATSISKMPKIRKELSMRVVPTFVEAHDDSEDLESGENSSILSVESDSERYSTDDMSVKVNYNVQKKSAIRSGVKGYSYREFSRNSTGPGAAEVDSGDGSNGSERSDHAKRTDGKQPQNGDVNSASFPKNSTRFKWSNVKTKIFYSFRALKASASSSSDGSRTISVKNLAREVTDDRLHDFFQDSGTILDIWIVRDAQSGLSSAYVEFDSGASARKAVQKSGKKLAGRVVMCDTAYENSRGGRSAPDSGHGAEAAKSELFESDWESSKSQMAETHAALKIFHPELQEGDAKFLSRFNEQINFRPYPYIQPSKGNANSVGSRSRPAVDTRGDLVEGSRGKAILTWTNSYEDSILNLGKNQAELGESVYCDAKNLELQQSSSIIGRKIQASWSRRTGKVSRFLLSWKWTRWQWWHLAKHSSTWTRRRPCACIDTEEKKIVRSVKNWHWKCG